MESLQERIPSLRTAHASTEVKKGLSPIDKKYIIDQGHGIRYLLRTAPIGQYERKNSLHRILMDLQQYQVRSPLPIEVGKVEELGICYQLLSYIDGEDAEEAIGRYPEQTQFQIGVDAGRDLARMHRLQAPSSVAPWHIRASSKHTRYLEAYKDCGIRLEDDHKILAFIEENQKWMADRPNLFQHDDFHLANLILKDGSYSGVIDFNNADWGDPLHDFHKLTLLNKEASVPFSAGQLAGYFENGQLTDLFWRLYSLYAAMGVFSVLVWSIRHTPDRVELEVERLMTILEEHAYFERLEPSWYRDFHSS
ncbi:aminoglycoside phosphotransferase [Paenibacillus sp. J31TS4]|uniref:aminoglycoside phosphotransferase family protein n=1 Tax=Paenibacillus sp. J31TS4 TaxID=2807195 RepID=UPI001B0ED434|nr:aminoglycoside phosphotransferase family protein [Paenibacillus sp. J31TS4]GIP37946.1 aminoglycoside phosphotransferase [Paenibacillus sp. J31TS4]